MASSTKTVFPIPEPYTVRPAPPRFSDYASHRDSSLIIDNGATTLRAGWSNSTTPHLTLDNIGSRYKERKMNETFTFSGSESYVDASSRSGAKSPFEGDVVCNYDVMENMLDYVFTKLDVQGDRVDHSVVMTEALGNPHYARGQMNEMLFEMYGVPRVAYGLDSLFGFYANNQQPATADAFAADGLVISSSTSATHVIPVLNGRAILTAAKKLNWGGFQSTDYLLKLMQLKYPTFPGRLAPLQAHEMYKQHSYHSLDYTQELGTLSDASKLAAIDRAIQFPFADLVSAEKTQEEIALAAQKRIDSGKRLQAQAAQQRLERMVKQEEELQVFGELKESKLTLKKADYEKRLKDFGFSSTEDLEQYLKKTEKSLTRSRNKDLGIVEDDTKEEPTFPLVNVPDHLLNEEDLKEKRRQRLMKAGYDARIRAKTERDEERVREAERKRVDEELRTNNFEGWLGGIRNKHERLIERIKERKKLKEQLSDRKSLAAQNRMKSIASLANEDKVAGGGPQKKKRRGPEHGDDDFGKNDSDWAVYKEIGGEDSEEEGDEDEALLKVEQQLLEHDPNFTIDHTAHRRQLRKHQLLNAYVRGVAPDDPLDTYDPESIEHNTRLHLNVERIRVPEVIWQPGMGGLDQAGLGEMVEHVLKQFTQEERDRLTRNVFVTGGNTLIPNFDARLHNTLRPVLPVSSPLDIVRSYDPAQASSDAWRGMGMWAERAEASSFVTKAQYDEYGSSWLAVHSLGNSQ